MRISAKADYAVRAAVTLAALEGDAPVKAERLADLGFAADERRRHWGARRVVVTAPGGHRVELMEAAPGRG